MRSTDAQPCQTHVVLPQTSESPSSAGREASSGKDVSPESDGDLQKTFVKLKPPDQNESSSNSKSLGLRKTDAQPCQTHIVLPKTSESPSIAGKEANSTKDVFSNNYTDLQQAIAQIKPHDLTVSLR